MWRAPLGYKLEKKVIQVLTIDKKAANKVRHIFEVFLEEFEIRKTAEIMKMPVSSISYILRNGFYCESKKSIIKKRQFNKVQKILVSGIRPEHNREYLKKRLLNKKRQGKSRKKACEELGIDIRGYYSNKLVNEVYKTKAKRRTSNRKRKN